MSTTDPTLARKLRQPRRPSLARVIVLLVLLAAGGFGLGYGWGSFTDFDEIEGPPILTLVGITGGLVVTILALIGWSWTVLKRNDIGFAYGASASFLGAGIGAFLAASEQAASHRAWPALVTIIAGALVGCAALLFGIGVMAVIARRRQNALDELMMRTGTLTTASVSDKGYNYFRESAKILTTVTFTFVDHQGTQRWVQRTMMIAQADPILHGQTTRLWYDPHNPGDTRRIVVELAKQNPVRG